jgi:hypothetical protein
VNYALKSFAIASLILLLNACNSSGGSDDTSSNSCNPGEGIPNVCGDYSYTTSDISYSCTDGATGTVAGNDTAQQVTIALNGNVITFQDSDKELPISGVTTLSDTGTSGTLSEDGSFTAERQLVVKFDQLEGEAHASRTTVGTISGVDLQATHTLEMRLLAYDTICTYVGSLSGQRLQNATSAQVKKDRQHWLDRHQADPYTAAIAAIRAKGFSANSK